MSGRLVHSDVPSLAGLPAIKPVPVLGGVVIPGPPLPKAAVGVSAYLSLAPGKISGPTDRNGSRGRPRDDRKAAISTAVG